MLYTHLILELFSYLLGFYFVIKKKELFIVYFPLILFFGLLIEQPQLPFLFQSILFTSFLSYSAYRSGIFASNNIYAFLLIVYFTYLYIFNSPGLVATAGYYFSMLWLLMSIIIIPNVMIKHDREVVYYEIYRMSSWIIILFLINSFISTVAGYYPYDTSSLFSFGNSYGTLRQADFNIMPIALFSFLLYNLKKQSLIRISIGFIALGLILFTMRRGLIFASFAGIIIILFLLWDKNKIKSLFLIIFISAISVFFILNNNEVFRERIDAKFRTQEPTRDEVIDLEDQRFLDHIWVYEDLFVFHRYSKMFGYEFFNSAGNFGDGILPWTSLHADLPVILHASGLIGLILYLLMIFRVFKQSFRNCKDNIDMSIWIFCLITFLIFTLVGRITSTPYAISLFILLMYPLSKNLSQQE